MFTCLGGSWRPNKPTNSRSTSVRPRAKARTRRPRLAMRLAACSSTYASFWSSGWLEPLALYCLHRGKISSIAPFYHNEPKLRIAFKNCWEKIRSILYFIWSTDVRKIATNQANVKCNFWLEFGNEKRSKKYQLKVLIFRMRLLILVHSAFCVLQWNSSFIVAFLHWHEFTIWTEWHLKE